MRDGSTLPTNIFYIYSCVDEVSCYSEANIYILINDQRYQLEEWRNQWTVLEHWKQHHQCSKILPFDSCCAASTAPRTGKQWRSTFLDALSTHHPHLCNLRCCFRWLFPSRHKHTHLRSLLGFELWLDGSPLSIWVAHSFGKSSRIIHASLPLLVLRFVPSPLHGRRILLGRSSLRRLFVSRLSIGL